MELTFVTELGETYSVEIDPDMELENIMALLEVESNFPVNEQSISYEGRELNNPKATMRELGFNEKQYILLLRRKVTIAGRPAEQDAEMMRLQILGDPQLMNDIRQSYPDLAEAAQSNPQRFAELLKRTQELRQQAAMEQLRDIERLNMDPYDVEAQKRIEEEIRQQAVMENLQHAIEYSPEAFGRVTMLYIPVEVNGHHVKAFVDSGAQQTIMSPECAEQCGIMRLLDRRLAGVARGVGTAKILGRVHSAQIKVSDLYLPCAFTIMEGRDVDLLFGLDMLKAHQACIDLEKNVLRIRDRQVGFLSEHELPEKARMEAVPDELVTPAPALEPTPGPSTRPQQPHFPGGGNVLGSVPASTLSPSPAPSQPPQSKFPESHIQTLMDLGVTREVAIRSLEAAGGNLDVAASLLF